MGGTPYLREYKGVKETLKKEGANREQEEQRYSTEDRYLNE